jgi:hypothetical protein
MKTNFFRVSQLSLAVVALAGLTTSLPVSGLPVSAQVTSIPSSSPTFGIDMTACRSTFDWNTFIADQRAGRTNTNPYIDQGCVSQKGVNATSGVTYASFSVGQASTKAAFGSDPVLGVFPNGNFPAQSLNTYNASGQVVASRPAVDRAQASGLSSTFTAAQLNEIFSTGGARTGMPRIFSTGPDTYTTVNGRQVYQGGWCQVQNGQISVRTTRAGAPFDPSLYGRNPADPTSACARTVNGTKLPAVEDRNLQVYQFVYEFVYPTTQQCADWFGVDAETCNQFFQNRYGRDLAGDTNTNSGRRIISTYTFYGSFDDKYSKWVGWHNPDVNGPRLQSADGFVRGYDGYSVYELS